MNTKLPSNWQLGDLVQVVFPGNAVLNSCCITKVSFTKHDEPLYDVEIPYKHTDYGGEQEAGKTGYYRLHGIREWLLSHTQKDWDALHPEAAEIS